MPSILVEQIKRNGRRTGGPKHIPASTNAICADTGVRRFIGGGCI